MNNKNLKKFEKNGYLILKNFISKKEINKIFKELHSLIDVCLENSNLKKFKKLRNIDEKYSLLLKKIHH